MTTAQPTVDVLPRRLSPLRKPVVGVDGGGTRTRAVILDGERILGEGTAGPSNPLRVGIANAGAAIREAIDKACAAALIHRDDIVAAGIGLAGVRRKDIRTRMREVLIEGLGIKNVEVVTDGEGSRAARCKPWPKRRTNAGQRRVWPAPRVNIFRWRRLMIWRQLFMLQR